MYRFSSSTHVRRFFPTNRCPVHLTLVHSILPYDMDFPPGGGDRHVIKNANAQRKRIFFSTTNGEKIKIKLLSTRERFPSGACPPPLYVGCSLPFSDDKIFITVTPMVGHESVIVTTWWWNERLGFRSSLEVPTLKKSTMSWNTATTTGGKIISLQGSIHWDRNRCGRLYRP